MALLKSATNVPGVDLHEYRDSLFYSKYQYRARVTVWGLHKGYYWTPAEFETRLNNNKLWGKITPDEKKTIRDNLESIKTLLQYKIDVKKNKTATCRCEHYTMAVFSNDLQSLHDSFDNLPNATVDYTECVTSGYSGIKHFVNEPKHKYRVYFKTRKIPSDFRDGMRKILSANAQLKPSPSLKYWISMDESRQKQVWYWSFNYLQATHFIDYNDESYLSYLALMYGDLLGKKYKLEKRPDIV